jgi:hypothetical protein
MLMARDVAFEGGNVPGSRAATWKMLGVRAYDAHRLYRSYNASVRITLAAFSPGITPRGEEEIYVGTDT